MESNLVKKITEAKEEATDANKNHFFQRLGGHFTAYLATSWLAYNWSNIAFLFMSKVPVEQRISAIYGQESLYFNYLIAPFITACMLSVFFPAMNALVANLTSFFSASSESAEKRARLLIENRLLMLENKKTETKSQIDKTIEQKKNLDIEVSILSSRYKELSKMIENSNLKIIALTMRSSLLINNLEALFLRSNNGKITISSDEIYSLYSDSERKEAHTWFKQIRDINGLDAALELTKSATPDMLLDIKYVQGIIKDAIKIKMENQRVQTSSPN
jgi:hypothetical protein